MISDERLREAARRAEESILASLPEPEDCEAVFYARFERKMRKLIRRTAHPIRYRVMKAAACFLLAALIGGGGILTFSTEARAAFAGWVREVYESYETWYAYHSTEEDSTASENIRFRPSWIPEGYTEQEVFELSSQTDIHYTNDAGSLLTFGYSSNSGLKNFYIEEDGAETHHVLVHNMSADLYLDNSKGAANILTWVNNDTNTCFWIIGEICSND